MWEIIKNTELYVIFLFIKMLSIIWISHRESKIYISHYNNFGIDIPAVSDELNSATIAKQKELQEKYKSIVSSRN